MALKSAKISATFCIPGVLMSRTKTVAVDLPATRFWGLTTFFNPQRYKGRGQLYRMFRDSAKAQGLPLVTVELAFGNTAFELQEGDAEILIQIRASRDNVMWQKERLFNIGFAHLPPQCDSFAWLDCDVLFDNPNWVRETQELLLQYAVVQPFSISARLPKGETTLMIQRANHPKYDRRPSVGYCYAHATPLGDYMASGHTGFGWTARREVFEGIGFYDRMIIGGGDAIVACGFFGRTTYWHTHLLPQALVEDQQRWISAMSERVRGSVSYTPGALLHLWHGTQLRRRVQTRLELLTRHAFDPAKDIRINADGCFVWAGNKPKLQKDLARYFWLRNEDESRVREYVFGAADRLGVFRRTLTARVVRQYRRAAAALATEMVSVRGPDHGQRLSLVIMNWERPQIVEQIVSTYSAYRVIGDIVVWNNNPSSSLDLDRLGVLGDVKSVTCKHDAGLDSRWAAGILGNHEHLLIHDDDILLTERQLTFLFAKYLRRPELSHGTCGRNVSDGYNSRSAFGDVDIVLTTCLILHKRYIRDYFERVALFDDLRSYGCGNGEDIIINYVIRSITGKKNRAHFISYVDANQDLQVSMHSISRRPRHLAVRNELVRRCMERLTGETSRLRVNDYGLNKLNSLYPATWCRYHEAPESLIHQNNFTLSANVDRERFAEALSLLCRCDVSARRIAEAGISADTSQQRLCS